MKLTQKAVAALTFRRARPIISNGTTGFPASASGCAAPLAARSIAHGSCSIVMAVPPVACCWAGRGARRRAGARLGQEGAGPCRQRRGPAGRPARPARQGQTYVQEPPSPIILRSSSATFARAPTPSWRAISPTSVISGRCTASARPDHPQGRCRPVEPDQLGKQLDRGGARPCPAFRVVFLGAGAWPVRSQPGGRHGAAEGRASRASACWRTPSWPRIWKACGDDDHGRCIKLLILTGCQTAGDRRDLLERV